MCSPNSNIVGVWVRYVVMCQVYVGDFVDLISAIEDEKLRVKRVRVLKVDEGRTSGGRIKVHLRVWRANVLLEAPHQWKSHKGNDH